MKLSTIVSIILGAALLTPLGLLSTEVTILIPSKSQPHFKIEVAQNATIGALKSLIFEKYGIPAETYKLVYKQKELAKDMVIGNDPNCWYGACMVFNPFTLKDGKLQLEDLEKHTSKLPFTKDERENLLTELAAKVKDLLNRTITVTVELRTPNSSEHFERSEFSIKISDDVSSLKDQIAKKYDIPAQDQALFTSKAIIMKDSQHFFEFLPQVIKETIYLAYRQQTTGNQAKQEEKDTSSGA